VRGVHRLNSGGRLDRNRPLEFTFNGRVYSGYVGDTLASALLANGVRVVGRSFKYHRPRGLVGSGSEEPNALVQLGENPRTSPNQIATQIELYDGLSASSVNCWPSVDFDLRSLTGIFSSMFPPGFYYKTFMWPRFLWGFYEHILRRSGGYGVSPDMHDPDIYDKTNTHCDVLVVGSGPAGLSAAVEAGRTGARVMLVDEQAEFGGSILNASDNYHKNYGMEWVSSMVDELKLMPEVTLLSRSTAFGYYDHNFVGVLERVTDHFSMSDGLLPRQKLWRIRAKEVVLATGSIERPLVFQNNDRPGVMLASAVSAYINRYAVKLGSSAVVFTNNDSAYSSVLDLLESGVDVMGVIDPRPEPNGTLPNVVRKYGIPIFGSSVIVNVKGSKNIRAVELMNIEHRSNNVDGKSRELRCDLVAVSGGWNPTVHLHSQSGGTLRYDAPKACFVPDIKAQNEQSVGSSNGTFDLNGCIEDGVKAGYRAAHVVGFGSRREHSGHTIRTDTQTEDPLCPMWIVPSNKNRGKLTKQFVDFQTDTSSSDIYIAAREGYESIEHVKRYTTLGMGNDQGKLGNINGIGILADALGQDISAIGTTTFRPNYTPISYGAFAGSDTGILFDPVRKTAIHEWHEEAGARFENVGQWKRPWFYPRCGESMVEAVERECLSVRKSVGVLDASTLGKIDIKGPNAIDILERVYTNSWRKLQVGQCRYGLMLGEDGMVIDDGVTARLGEDHYLMHTTSSGAGHVMNWIELWLQTEWPSLKVYLTSVTDQWATVQINGPNSRNLLSKICKDVDLANVAFPYMAVRIGTVAGLPARIFRVSFVGELSYEINVNADYGLHLWEAVMEAGEEYGITPFGTEAMHLLRAEKGYVIIGQDTDGSMTPSDLGMNWIVAKHKDDFLGKRSLSREDSIRTDRKQLVGLITEDPSMVIPEGSQVIDRPAGSIPIPMLGHITSSYMSPTLGYSIALGFVKGGHSKLGERVYISINDSTVIPAFISNRVFYDPEGKRQDG
jgi:sarcosine oxidase subunit alpha